jgi:serine/threonine protein kinase
MIGHGRIADVYLGDDLVLERAVAIKILHEQVALDLARLEQFRREAVTLACVRSPYVLGVYDIGLVNEGVYLVMPYIEGVTVAQYVARHGPMPRARAEVVLTQLLSGLAAMHAQGLVHHDLKPANVLLDRNDDVVLIDLDLGLAHDPKLTSATATGTGTTSLTDLAAVTDAADYTSDVYQVGMLMVYLLTGIDVSRRSHRSGFEDLIQQLPRALASVARRALDTDATARFASAAIMKEALEVTILAALVDHQRPSYARTETLAREPSEHMRTPLIVSRERRNVLVVDEDKSFGNTIYRLLTPAYRVFLAGDAGQAFAQLVAGSSVDVLLCGMASPVEFHARLSTMAPALAATTLFLTSCAYDARTRAFVEGLPNRRLGKPIEVGALQRLIAEQLASARHAPRRH